MNITDLKVSKTIQVNQYEPVTIEAHATIDEGESFEDCATELLSRITNVLTGKKGKKAPAADTSSDEEDKAPAKKSKPEKKKAPKKAKAVAYDREVKAHKKEFGGLLHEHFEGWKEDDDLKAKAKEVSATLTGKDFMDAKGNVLDSFVEALKEEMDDGL